MDFWACAEEADRLCNAPGKKQKAGGKMRCYRRANRTRACVLGCGVCCSAAESLTKSVLSPCLIFPMWTMKFPYLSKMNLGEIYTKGPIRLCPLYTWNKSGLVITGLILGHEVL